MNLYFKNLIKYAAAVFCGAIMFACTDLSELEDRVDSLDSRITALEKQLVSLQGNIDAVNAMFNEQIFITAIAPGTEAGEYKLTMSDGKTYTIKQGQVGNTPQMAVDEEGYWIVSYDNGKSFSRVSVNGEDVPVAASPKFRVNDAGNWEVSTDGKTWSAVCYIDGTTPVPALGEGGDFFKNVDFDEESGTLTLTFADGKTYSFTADADFVCKIENEENPVKFGPGATREFNVVMKGVSTVYIVKPEGWHVTLEGDDASDPATEVTAKLTVTAPGVAAQTKISADSDNDIVLHAAASQSDRSIFAKMTVELSELAVPSVSITKGDVTANTVSFTFAPNEDVTSWKYMLLPASAAAPSEKEDFGEKATEGNAENLTVTFDKDADGNVLYAGNDYTVYVLAVNSSDGAESINITSATSSPVISDYYDAYMAGTDIKIGDKIYNISEYGDPVLVTAANPEITATYAVPADPEAEPDPANARIYFIEPDANATWAGEGNIVDMVIIGTESGTRSKLTVTKQMKLNKGSNSSHSGQFVISNIDFDASALANYPIAVYNNGEFDYVMLHDSKIKCNPSNNRPLSYINNAASGLADFNMVGCVYEFTSASQNFIINTGSANTSTYGKLNFSNNIFYIASGAGNKFMAFNGKARSVDSFVFNGNTVVNLNTGTTFLINAKTLTNVEIKDNLIYSDQNMGDGNSGFIRIEDFATTPPTSAAISHNIAYKTDPNRTWQAIYGGKALEGAENITIIEENPFTGGTFNLGTGVFIPNGTYSAYGSTICR